MSLNNYLENKTILSIKNDINNVLINMNINIEQRNELLNKLKYYRFVDKIYELHTGKHTRWLCKDNY